ncbi:MAG: tetratricopeptide repeat protein, partial [Nitrospira sp.]|nr:tetratricopeptide repeat protein [Nitrospira sp.]
MPARKKATLPSRRWLCPQYIVALFLLSSVHAIAAEVHSEQSSPPAGSQSVVAAPHQIPVLPPEVATEIEEIEQQIDAVLGRGEERSQEEIQPLIQAAERVVALRTKTQGEQWWETIDSRQRITDLQTWARRTHGQQAELAEEAELSRQVVSLYQEKKYKDALDPATRSISILRKVLGESHLKYAASLNNLALLYKAQGQYAEAKPLLERALGIYEKVLGREHPLTGTSLNNLAELYRAQGQYAEAKPLYQRALAINEKVLGLDDAETATSLNNLALLYKAQKQYAEAKPLLERALGIYEKVLGREHPLTATSLNNLAELYRAQGQDAQAKPLYQRALAINEKSLGLEHLHTAASLNNLALLYMGQGAYPEAQPLLARALAIHEGLLGAGHPHTATSLNNLALLYEAQGQYAQVRPLYERALAIREKVLGPDHPDTAMSLNDLAALYWAQGQYAQAKPLYERALAIREKVLGPDHPDTAMSLNNLALLYRDQGQYAKVRPLLERALAIYESLLGSEHPSTAVLLENVAENSMASSPDEAAGLLLRASQAKWRYLTKTFPTLSTQAQQRFLATNGLQRTPHYFWSLFTARPGVDRRFGLQATLLSKQLLAEAGRQESSAMRQVLADAAPAWRALWHERDGLRRRYATLAFQSSPDSALQQSLRGSPDAGAVQAIGQLTVRLEQLEARLRSESPAYARQAQLDETSVAQVMKSLQATHALLEYVQFQPYDQKTKKLTDSRHYGVYVVRGDKTPVVAVDLGEAASIDAAIRQFHAGMREIINKVNNEMTPSPAQFRKSEAALAQWSSKLRTWIWQPLEPHLRGVTRVYVAPEGQLSLLPFEVLANKTKKKEWQYLVEEQELVYLNTGRDLARLALTAKTQHAAPTKTKTAVLIGNPAFDASPQHVARAVAAMPMTPPTLMAQGDSRGGVPTLGTTAGNGSQRLQVPRNWEPVPALGALLNHAQHQLTR